MVDGGCLCGWWVGDGGLWGGGDGGVEDAGGDVDGRLGGRGAWWMEGSLVVIRFVGSGGVCGLCVAGR